MLSNVISTGKKWVVGFAASGIRVTLPVNVSSATVTLADAPFLKNPMSLLVMFNFKITLLSFAMVAN